MREMQALEYAYMVKELGSLTEKCIIGKRFAKIYDIGEGAFRLKIGGEDIIVRLGMAIYRAVRIPESAELGGFSQLVRKELKGKKLDGIEQLNGDRIVVMRFGELMLVLEMFGKGNAMLVKNGIIVACYRKEEWKGRRIARGEKYIPPPAPARTVRECLSSRYVASDLAKLPFGTLYAREALYRCGIDEKKPGNTLTDGEIGCIEKAFVEISDLAKPRLFYDGNAIVDYGLTAFREYASFRTEDVTLSEAIERLVESEPATGSKGNNELWQKLERRNRMQLEAMEKLAQEEKAAQMKGEWIYSHYATVEEVLRLAREGKWDELSSMYPGMRIDLKKKEITLALRD